MVLLTKFLRNPSELKNIKNISLLRQQMCLTTTKSEPSSIIPNITIKPEPTETIDHKENPIRITAEYDEKPTDLSMEGPTDLSSTTSRHVNIVCSPDPPIAGLQ
ncbi:hypothetical protein NQ315_013191 [Exocentrus adspersus]|uniref:Uncharacterized protein n=1 Tax=Exocentrus adspersus TaxID=1586481 RepID=A0AAV8VDS5_9CUCU|nr:hypothetical protein NQ315_013191 [Exocentrus adspersus]